LHLKSIKIKKVFGGIHFNLDCASGLAYLALAGFKVSYKKDQQGFAKLLLPLLRQQSAL
jgi:hypothetical protein